MDFDRLFTIIVATVLCVIVVSASSCSINRTSKIAEMVKGGADPIRAACALRGEGSEPICVLAVVK